MLAMTTIALEIKFRAFTQLRQHGSACIDDLLDSIRHPYIQCPSKALHTPASIRNTQDLGPAIRASRAQRKEEVKRTYAHESLFSHDQNNLGNRWFRYYCQFLNEGDKIRILRLRSNLWPTRTLSKRHLKDSSRLCRRCGREPETAYHILQVCPAAHDSRVKRCDFIRDHTERMLRGACPNARPTEKKTTTASDYTRPRHHSRASGQGPDSRNALDAETTPLKEAPRRNAAEYNVLTDNYLFPAEILGVTFGARSVVAPSTKCPMSTLGVNNSNVPRVSARVPVGSLITLDQ